MTRPFIRAASLPRRCDGCSHILLDTTSFTYGRYPSDVTLTLCRRCLPKWVAKEERRAERERQYWEKKREERP